MLLSDALCVFVCVSVRVFPCACTRVCVCVFLFQSILTQPCPAPRFRGLTPKYRGTDIQLSMCANFLTLARALSQTQGHLRAYESATIDPPGGGVLRSYESAKLTLPPPKLTHPPFAQGYLRSYESARFGLDLLDHQRSKKLEQVPFPLFFSFFFLDSIFFLSFFLDLQIIKELKSSNKSFFFRP